MFLTKISVSHSYIYICNSWNKNYNWESLKHINNDVSVSIYEDTSHKIFDIDILNLETDYNKIHHDFDHVV